MVRTAPVPRLLLALSLAALAPLALASSTTQGGRARLARPLAEPDDNASGLLSVKHYDAVGDRVERSWIKVKARRLGRETEYTLWANDPATGENDLVQFAAVTTSRGGSLALRIDTKDGDALPFGATLAGLSGGIVIDGNNFEVRDGDGTAVLFGAFPFVPGE